MGKVAIPESRDAHTKRKGVKMTPFAIGHWAPATNTPKPYIWME